MVFMVKKTFKGFVVTFTLDYDFSVLSSDRMLSSHGDCLMLISVKLRQCEGKQGQCFVGALSLELLSVVSVTSLRSVGVSVSVKLLRIKEGLGLYQ